MRITLVHCLFASSLLLSPVFGQSLGRVEIRPGNRSLDAILTAYGLDHHDVLAERAEEGTYEIIAPLSSLPQLTTDGLEPKLLERGRPFRDIQRERALAGTEGVVPAGYPDLATVIAEMTALAAGSPIARLVDLTQEYGVPATDEGRHIFAVKVSDNPELTENEPRCLLVSCHHAREIVTPTIGLEIINRFVAGWGTDAVLTGLIEDHEIWVAPVWNPDGYEYVFTGDNLWRKNRHMNGGGTIGVDLNRNYPFGWSQCGGTSSTGGSTYWGASAASEAETQTMVAFGSDMRFNRVFDFHSSGEHVRYGYGCFSHPFLNFLEGEASQFSQAGGYGGDTQTSCCTGGNFGWHAGTFGSHSFLWETANQFQPSYASAQAEAAQVFPGVVAFLQREASVQGTVRDSCTGLPIDATLELSNAGYQLGEVTRPDLRFGTYQLFLPTGPHFVEISAPGYATSSQNLVVSTAGTVSRDIWLDPLTPTPMTYCTAKVNTAGCTPSMGWTGTPSATDSQPFLIEAAHVMPGQFGLMFYAFETDATPFLGGTRCVGGSLGRTPVQLASNAGGTCGGVISIDFNSFIQGGTDPLLISGTSVYTQFFYRDPASVAGIGLTDGLAFCIQP